MRDLSSIQQLNIEKLMYALMNTDIRGMITHDHAIHFLSMLYKVVKHMESHDYPELSKSYVWNLIEIMHYKCEELRDTLCE